jgi:hypothetical protein
LQSPANARLRAHVDRHATAQHLSEG